MYLYQWMLLAWPSCGFEYNGEFGMLQDSEDEQGVLGEQDSEEQGTGQRRAAQVGGNGLALYHGVGV